MNSLTRSLMLNSGMLNTPLLFTTGIVHPDKKLTESEIDLYDARKALKHLEDGIEQVLGKNEILKRTQDVQSAITNLGPSEGRYFQMRYIHKNVVLQRASKGRRRADSASASKAAEARARAAAERARKASEDLAKEREKERAEEEAYEKEQARRLAEEEKKAKNDAQRAAVKKKEAERLKKRDLLLKQAEKRRQDLKEKVEAEAVAARKAAEALERNRKREEALAEKERLAELAEKQKKEREKEIEENKKKTDQLKRDLELAQELWEKDILKQRLKKQKEQADRLAREKQSRKEKEKQIESDRALAQRLRDEDFKKVQEAEEELKKRKGAADRADNERNWRNQGWKDDWIKVDVLGDGNCLFHAVCTAMGKGDDPNCHKNLRKEAMDYLQANLDTVLENDGTTFRQILADTYGVDPEDYIRNMRMNAQWGSDIEIRAIVGVLQLQGKALNIIMEYPGEMLVNTPPIDGHPDDLHIYHKTPGNHYQAYVHKDRR